MNRGMKRAAGILVLVVTPLATLLAPVGVKADVGRYVITSFDFPGTAVTQAYGINARGDIVGTYRKAAPNNKNRGFLLKGGEFTSVDFPGINTDWSIATAIGPAGDIAGYYGLVGEAPTSAYGFLLDKYGEWTTVPNLVDPVPTMTPAAFRILPNGTMVGCFHYATPSGEYTSMHGFTLTRDGTFSRFDYPAPESGSFAMHYGATPDGKWIVGTYTAAGVSHGYLLVKGDVITFDVPGSLRTVPQDINAGGVIVGNYRNPGEPSSASHGFILDTHRSIDQTEWEYSRFDVAGASVTRIRGINAGGDIVGDYIGTDGQNHAFVASPSYE